jgi:hypothetical protein
MGAVVQLSLDPPDNSECLFGGRSPAAVSLQAEMCVWPQTVLAGCPGGSARGQLLAAAAAERAATETAERPGHQGSARRPRSMRQPRVIRRLGIGAAAAVAAGVLIALPATRTGHGSPDSNPPLRRRAGQARLRRSSAAARRAG